MADNNLNFMIQGSPAGQLMDEYSQSPGFIKSKNVDIFSSSQSVKATAWSEPEELENEIVDIEETGRFELHGNGRVWDNKYNRYVTTNSMNLGAVKKVQYGGNSSQDPSMGTPKKLFVEREDDESEYKTITVVTDKIIYTAEATRWTPKIKLINLVNCQQNSDGSLELMGNKNYMTFDIVFDIPGFSAGGENLFLRKEKKDNGESLGDATIRYVHAYRPSLIYDPNSDRMVTSTITSKTVSTSGDGPTFSSDPSDWGYEEDGRIEIANFYVYPEGVSPRGCLRVRLDITEEDGTKFNGKIFVDYEDTIRSYTNFLPYLKNRIAKKTGKYYVIGSLRTTGIYQFLPVYDLKGDETISYETLARYDFKKQIELPAYHGLDVVDVVITDQNIYRFGNNKGIGYISIFPLVAGDEGEHITYPGIEFIGAIRQNNVIYIIANNRGVSGLYAYSGHELVPVIYGNLKSDVVDLINNKEQFRFQKIGEWRGYIVLGTDDGGIFMFGQTFGAKGMSKIHSLNGKIKEIIPTKETLKLMYQNDDKLYQTILQDTVAIKNYNSDFEIVYPISIGNHILEKEETDLYVSYILPSSDCKIEVWGMANHYHFWTFTSNSNVELDKGEIYKMKGCTGNYGLKFLEKNGNQYTFELVGDLPIQTNKEKKITKRSGQLVFSYSDFNHFKKIGEIGSEGYKEGYQRIHNINNLLKLPRTHALQIMIKGYGAKQHSPEIFAVNFISSQKNRG